MASQEGKRGNGASNSRSLDARVRDLSVQCTVGFDTCSFAWRPTAGRVWNLLDEAVESRWLDWPPDTPVGHRREMKVVPSTRGSYLFAEPVLGMRVGFYPEHQLIYAEGRLAGLVEEPDLTALVSPSHLKAAALRMADELSEYGLDLWGQEPRIRRLDLAADVRVSERGAGLALLALLAQSDLPRLKRTVWSAGPHPETIYFRTPNQRTTQVRIYDKALQSGTGPRGTWIRLERQLRYPKAAQQTPSEIATLELGKLWLGPMAEWLSADASLHVGTSTHALAALAQAVEAGKLKAIAAERLAGFAALQEIGCDHSWWRAAGSPHIPRRRIRDLAAAGVVLGDRDVPPCPVVLGDLMHHLVALWDLPT